MSQHPPQRTDDISIPPPNLGIFQSTYPNTYGNITPGGAILPPQINGVSPNQTVAGSMPSQGSSGSSYAVLSYQTGNSSNNGYMHVFQNGGLPPNVLGQQSPGMSLTDVSLEKAMEKVQELAYENATLRGMCYNTQYSDGVTSFVHTSLTQIWVSF